MRDEAILAGGSNMQSADLFVKYVENDPVSQCDMGLVTAVRARSETAFADLHNRYAASLYRRIYSIIKNREDAEDVLQETLLRAYLGIDSFEGRSKLETWLTRIAINTSLMALRKRRTRPEASFESLDSSDDELPSIQVEDPGLNPEQSCLQHERKLRIAKAMAVLKPPLRVAMQIRLSTGSSIEEIARLLDVSVAAAKARLYRARRHTIERLQREV